MSELLHKPDEELVILTLSNKDFYIYLVEKYEEKLRRYVRRISNISTEEIDDVLQEIFIKVYKNLNAFDQSLKFSSWIYRIAHNETISYVRKIQARPMTIGSENSEEMFELLEDELDIESEAHTEQVKKKILSCIQSLDQKYREVIILKYLEEKDYQEISDILKKPMGTIATLLSRAKELLKKELLQNHVEHR